MYFFFLLSCSNLPLPFFFFLIEVTFIKMRVSKYWLTVFSALNPINALNSDADKSSRDYHRDPTVGGPHTPGLRH